MSTFRSEGEADQPWTEGWIDAEARKLGELLGKPETIDLGVLALHRSREPTIDSAIVSTK